MNIKDLQKELNADIRNKLSFSKTVLEFLKDEPMSNKNLSQCCVTKYN